VLCPLRGYNKLLMYYIYLLENEDDKSWYIGFTTNIKERVDAHNQNKGGRTTKKKLRNNFSRGTATKSEPWKLIYHEMYLDKMDAIGREKFLKSGSGRRYLKKQLVHYLKNV